MTQGAIEVWATLPEEIRHDQSFVPFHQEHERMRGKQVFEPDFETKTAHVNSINIDRSFRHSR